ncbi:MAG TPA: ion channel [Candidatus Binataceae bacterium]|nr:ion channel [Candidatus Binataceae bacterium]
MNQDSANIELDGKARDNIGRITSGAPRARLSDLYFFLTTISWPALLLIIMALFGFINCLFALGYMIDGGVANARPGSFADAFFFSVQTMATIGYGTMAPRSFVSNIMVSIEALSGLTALAVVTGLVFARFSRPTARVRFSRVVAISARDGVPSLMFRAVNQRSNRIVEAQIHVVLSRWETTREGESMRRFYDLALARGRNALFSLSWTVIHPIVEGSPLLGETAASLKASRSMIIASLVGMDESFLQNVHVRYVWVADEIVWGMRFADVLHELPDGTFLIDYSRFDEVLPAAPAPLDGAASER